MTPAPEEEARRGVPADPVRRPFLKWAGGKTRLVGAIRALVPAETSRLIEPFAGSGAAALNLGFAQNLVADANADLVGVFLELKERGEAFLAECEAHFMPRNNTERAYYRHRAEFNAATDRATRARLFVYLNRHGYNGLCRYNSRGGFNVPFGRYVRPRLPVEAMRAFQVLLQRSEVRHADFRTVIAEAGAGDFVYCDPPYVPASSTANFTAYAQHGFTLADQADLVAVSRAAAERGACVVISNHDNATTRELYREADECRELLVARRISCRGDRRAPASELLVVFRPAKRSAA